ncbi:MAG: serine/threonine protein kinase [Bacteroidales bacterium]|nr:serine/threonine protein kinase [Bacteroidales bacterium]
MDKADYILKDLYLHFEIRKIFKIKWEKEFFVENLKSFYAHSQKHLNQKEYEILLQNKKKKCGDGDFFAIIFKDNNPKFDNRETTSGITSVNVNVYDKKIEYRELLDEKYNIHASNDEWETNKDLTVLFGLNLVDFCAKYPINDEKIEIYTNNVVGVGGFKDIKQLFYLLNNTIKYCVLRNFECLPTEYTVEGHGDIDLLVENKNYISYLTQAIPIYKEDYRVYHTIKIDGNDVPFDFRYVGDDYYDKPWEINILKTRQKNDCFFIPNSENLYFSLLYHAYIQKRSVRDDYLPKLKQYAIAIGKEFSEEPKLVITQIDSYLKKYEYEYVRPKDKTVFYNINNLMYSTHLMNYGQFIRRREIFVDNSTYVSKVYKKEHSFIKKGTPYLINNEFKFLKRLDGHQQFPRVIDYKENSENESLIELSYIQGMSFEEYFVCIRNQRLVSIKMFVKQMFSILCILKEKEILHRDVNPQNIIINKNGRKCDVGLIDFGWAVDIPHKDNCITPSGLGTRAGFPYRPTQGYSDFYSMGVILEKYWGHWPYIKKISRGLKEILSEDYENMDVLNVKINKVKKCIYEGHIGMTDIRREIGVYYRGLKSIRKRLLS